MASKTDANNLYGITRAINGGDNGQVDRGVLSILKLSHEIAVSEAVEAQNNRHQKIEEAISAIKAPDGRGAYVELPGPPT